MDIRQLKYFITITDEGGVTAAAQKLHMSQPPLSKQLMLLENELGVTLFDRKNKSLILTNEGRLLYQQASIIVQDFEQTLQIFDDMKNGISGTLHIGCITSLAILFFPTFIKEFIANNPKLNLQMYESNTQGLLNLLDQHTTELCIIKNNYDLSQYNSINIDCLVTDSEDCLCAVALPHYFSTLEDTCDYGELKDKKLIVQRFYSQAIKNACLDYNFEPDITCSHESVMTSLNWCLCDMGISIIPYSASRLTSLINGGEKLIIKKLISPCINSGTSLVWSSNHNLSPTALQFIKAIKEMIDNKN